MLLHLASWHEHPAMPPGRVVGWCNGNTANPAVA